MRRASTAPQGGSIQPAGGVLPAAGRQAWLGPAPRPQQIVLKELRVRDLALVAESRVRFGPGLNLLTGETGSGKSLIVDALSLTLGARGGADQVRHGAERATVEGVFESGGAALVLQRELGKRSAARIDGRQANPGQLRELGRALVALHGQHEHHALLDTDTQTELLDAYGGAVELRAATAAAHSARMAELGHEAISALHEDALARAAASLGSAAELDPRLREQATRLAGLESEV